MKRIAQPAPEGWIIPQEALVPLEGGMGGPAARRLAVFEEMAQGVLDRQEALAAQLDRLRRENKTKTAQFRELLGKKLMNTQMISLLQAHGLLEEEGGEERER